MPNILRADKGCLSQWFRCLAVRKRYSAKMP
jgi:hypothetical protein